MQAGARDGDGFERPVLQRAVAELRLAAPLRHVAPQLSCSSGVQFLHQVPGRIERRVVIEQADPQRRQRAQPVPRPAVGAAHLEEALQPHLGEGGGQWSVQSPMRGISPGSAGSLPCMKSRNDWPLTSMYLPSR